MKNSLILANDLLKNKSVVKLLDLVFPINLWQNLCVIQHSYAIRLPIWQSFSLNALQNCYFVIKCVPLRLNTILNRQLSSAHGEADNVPLRNLHTNRRFLVGFLCSQNEPLSSTINIKAFP